jgi:hypothetical protein
MIRYQVCLIKNANNIYSLTFLEEFDTLAKAQHWIKNAGQNGYGGNILTILEVYNT